MNDLSKLNPSFFDREHNLVNLSNSLLNHFGVKTYHPTLQSADLALKGHKKVALFLFDGMGELVLKDLGKTGEKILTHKIDTIYSTNPATTVAATNALLSARYPIETGWLGWSLYMDEIARAVDVFPNKDSYTKEKLGEPHLMNAKCPYENIVALMKKQGVNAKLMLEYPFGGCFDGPKKLREFEPKATKFFQSGGEFLYGYWTNPDDDLHEYGTKSWHVKWDIWNIRKVIERFAKKNPDVLLFVIADHGLIDVKADNLALDKEIDECLDYPMCLEGRTPSFKIKKGMEEQFEKAFEKHFGSRAVLMTKEEAFSAGYFGEGTPHEKASSLIMDYVAVMLDETIVYREEAGRKIKLHKGHHAGGMDKERLIALMAYNL